MTPRLLTRPEAERYLGIARAALQKLVRAGAVPRIAVVFAPGKRPTYRYDSHDLDQFIERSRTRKVAPRPCAG